MPPEVIDRAEIDALITRLDARSLREDDPPRLAQLLRLLVHLADELESQKTSLHRLQRLLFGSGSERRSPVIASVDASATAGSPSGSSDEAQQTAGEDIAPAPKAQRRGHGRLGASRFTGAERVRCDDPRLRPGGACPECLGRGRLYDTNEPSVLIKRVGRPIVSALAYERTVLRCSRCQERFRAPLPDGVTEQLWDPSADVAIAIHKYAAGMPWYRLARLQLACGVPVPASTQWERCEHVADCLLPVFAQLEKLAAGAELFTVDDTRVVILDLLRENKALGDGERRGMFTTGVIAEVGRHKLAFYYSGRQHAGENLAKLLKNRPAGLEPPITMADALARNWPPGFVLIVAKCLVHGRRQFIDIESSFPREAEHVLDALAKVYRCEAQTTGMTADARLAYHQQHSAPVMAALRVWIDEQLERAEPNSTLPPALKYFARHWDGLTRFLVDGRCPLDSNAVERALKLAVLNRKNALFYRTQHGADVGDLIASVVETCRLGSVNVWRYLVDVVSNPAQVRAEPTDWLPWVWAARQRAPDRAAA